jgi:hypothetical protein
LNQEIIMAQLDEDQLTRLQAALMAAFDADELAQLVRTTLGQTLAHITEGGSLSSVVFQLIEWAERNDQTGDLVQGAHRQRPRSQALAALAAEIGGGAKAARKQAAAQPPVTPGGFTIGEINATNVAVGGTQIVIQTGGGAYIGGGVNTGGGPFVGRDAGAGEAQAKTVAGSTPTADVLFDVGHGQQAWGGPDYDSERPQIDFDYAGFAGLFAEAGCTVEAHGSRLTAASLAGSSVLVMVSPLRARCDAEEIKALLEYVAAGGRLLALGYYGGDAHLAANLSELLQPYGIGIDASAVRDAKLPVPGPEGVTALAAGDAFTFLGEGERAFLPNCAALRVTPPATAVLVSQDDAHTLRFTYKGNTTRVDSVQEAAEGVQIVGAVRRYGRKGGRVAVLGSWEALTDRALADGRYANGQLARRLIAWLLEVER